MRLLFAAALLFVGPVAVNPCMSIVSGARANACCKTCSKGKACGDSCISRDKTCHKGQGCACDG